MACSICEGLEKEKTGVVFENDKLVALLKPDANSLGQVSVVPKSHYTIFEQVPDDLVEEIFDTANKLSLVLVESLGAQGVNLLVNNGISAGQKVPHFFVDLIPRFPEDGIDLTWAPKQMSQEQLSAVEVKIKEVISGNAQEGQQVQQMPIQQSAPVVDNQSREIDSDDDVPEDYLLKSIERIP